MNKPLRKSARALPASVFVSAALALAPGCVHSPDVVRPKSAAPAVAKPQVSAPVTVTDNGRTWTLDNGIVKATINKRNGNMTALVFHGINTMGRRADTGNKPPPGQVTQIRHDRPRQKRRRARRGRRQGRHGGTVMLTPARPAAAPIATSKSATPWAAATAASTPTPFAPTRPLTAPGEGESRYITKLNQTSTGSPWTPTATCSNARRRTGARASSSTPRNSGS